MKSGINRLLQGSVGDFSWEENHKTALPTLYQIPEGWEDAHCTMQRCQRWMSEQPLGHTLLSDKRHFRKHDPVHPKAHKVHQKHLLFLSPAILHQCCLLETGSVSHTDSLNKISMLVQGGSGKWETTGTGGKCVYVSC